MQDPAFTPRSRRMYRSRENAVLMGVCGGIAEHFDFNPLGVRLIFVLLALTGALSFPILITYIILGFMMKPAPGGAPPLPGGRASAAPRFSTRLDALREVQRRFDRLEERLRRMESIVTDPRFAIEEEYRRL